MHLSLTLALTLSILSAGTPASASTKQPPKDAILLSDVRSLTLRGGGAKTTHRRVAAAPQLRCLSPKPLCALHDMDVMRCTNQGGGYGGPEDVQWSCVASLPEELRLGSTDVVCEGYSSPDDPYVLRGSCGVEYRLALTEKGERRWPDLGKGHHGGGGGAGGGDGERDVSAYLFGILFFAVLAWIVYSACVAGAQTRRTGGGAGRRRGGGGGGGGGWGGGGGGGGGGWDPGFRPDDNDPPPPYPGTKPQGSSQQGWRPGFWTGAGAGAAAGYGAGYYQGSRNQRGYGTRWGNDSSSTSSWGAGPSRSSTSSSSSSARHESTGFGSTSRR